MFIPNRIIVLSDKFGRAIVRMSASLVEPDNLWWNKTSLMYHWILKKDTNYAKIR